MSQFLGVVHHIVQNKMERGELNIDSLDALKKVLKEYEIHTKIIEEQLELCKKDHEDLRAEMSRLMQENRDLTDRLKRASENSLYKADQLGIKLANSDLSNVQQQLALALEETETVKKLWEASVREADELKDKLREYESGNKSDEAQRKLDEVQKDYTEAIKILEEKRSFLKHENDQLSAKCQSLEDQVNDLNSQLESANEKNNSLKSSLRDSAEQEQEWKSKYLDLEAKYIDLDRAYQADKVKYAQIAEYEKNEAALTAKLEESLRARDELQDALERCQECMQEQLRLAAQDRCKVEEAVALVEGACRDREEALGRERAAVEELQRLRAELDKLVDEAGKRVVAEGEELRRAYDSQLATVKEQLALAEQDRTRKSIEVEQLQKECERLQSLLTQNSAGAERQVERLNKQLGTCEACCDQLREENAELRQALDVLEERCRRNTKRREKLQKDLNKLVKDTQVYQQELAMSEQKADLLNSQLHATSLDLAKLQSNTILNPSSSTATNAEPAVSLSSTLELYKRLNESYTKMNDKWKDEMNNLTDKFEEKLKKVKKQSKRSPERVGTRVAT